MDHRTVTVPVIGLIDFGKMVGTVDPATRAALRAILVVLVDRDTAPLVDAFVALGMTTTPLDPNQLAPWPVGRGLSHGEVSRARWGVPPDVVTGGELVPSTSSRRSLVRRTT